jgi:hypothetical protein
VLVMLAVLASKLGRGANFATRCRGFGVRHLLLLLDAERDRSVPRCCLGVLERS